MMTLIIIAPSFTFQEFIGDLAQAVQAAECEEFVVECLGVMGNLSVENMDWERLIREYQLVPWLRAHLVQGELLY